MAAPPVKKVTLSMQSINSSDCSSEHLRPENTPHQTDQPSDESSIDSPCASPTAKKKKIDNTEERENESVDKIDHLADPPEFSMLESLQWKTESALDRIFSELRTNEDCPDLLSLSKVSRIVHKGAHEFTRKDGNRPGLRRLLLKKNKEGRLKVVITLFPSNIPFHDLACLDSGRFKRSMKYEFSVGLDYPTLQVTLTGIEDPLIDQMTNFLASPIKIVYIGEYRSPLSSADLSLCDKLLTKSSIDSLQFEHVILDDNTVTRIQSISSRATNDLRIFLDTHSQQSQFTDAASFIDNLGSLSTSRVFLHEVRNNLLPPYPFFGLLRSIWEKFLNEKLSSGSFELIWVHNGIVPVNTFTKAPINLPDTPIRYLEWWNVKAK